LSLVEEVVHYLSWMLVLALWWNILGKEGLSCYLLELVRNFCILLVFLLVSWLFLSKPLEEYKGIHPPLSLSHLSLDKLLNKVARRSKKGLHPPRFTLLVLFSLGSKKAYTPREVTQLALTTRDPITQLIRH
jgi:hypothetical protein